ncbi:hypothetical protein SCHPADRAFT_880969 [Schizopora paradoxa]|uniref:Ribosome biogenesis protein NSA1 n=1 Tax=Schizopora paradoxa TaxID=27342 RepID=A0A0H2REM6_9AGAM|nr:hypothetical protein SCHPADRAFT_880969 [Schizopora paradoxa]
MKGALPMNLRSWQLSSDAESFCYGGTEVDLSVWDTTRTFSDTTKPSQTFSDGKKRGRGSELYPAETWRAKNLPNDNLNLRQPIDITSISYLASSSKQTLGSGVHLVTGTQVGDVRRYDTRAARKPVANWAGIGKVGGVNNVKAGLREHELYVSDNGSNLSAVDLRNGRVVYSYKQIQGTISDIVVTSSFLASTSQDRFFRLHSTVPPSETAGRNQDARGKVLSSLYMKSIPTAVALDPLDNTGEATDASPVRVSGEFDEDPWEGMQDLSDDEDNEKPRKMRRRPNK